MIEQAVSRLDRLAQADATVATLARLQAEALRAAGEGAWDEGVPALDPEQAGAGVPLLRGRTLRADAERIRRLLIRLATVAGGNQSIVVHDAMGLVRAVEQARLDAALLLRAAVVQDGDAQARLADEAAVDAAFLAMLGQLAAMPLLQACGRWAQRQISEMRWQHGFCPVCAAWPTLSELRGLERTRWLRCGRCGSGWAHAHAGCVYCGAQDRRSMGYLAPERERESRRAVTCDACQGYLKAVTTLHAIAPAEIAVMDVQTLELDVAALEQGYGRPDVAAFPLDVSVELIERARPERRSRWVPWRR